MAGNLVGMFVSGGPIMFVLLALSILSLTIITAKVVQLWNVRSGGTQRSAALGNWQSGERQQAFDTVRTGRAPADRVMAYAMEALDQGLSGPKLDAELARRGNEELARMSGAIRILELIAMISPLLGLLGTVLGMIQSFQELELAEGSANASVLAGGIWLALLTTAAGLLTAIPAAVGASLISGRVESATLAIEGAISQLMLTEAAKPGAIKV